MSKKDPPFFSPSFSAVSEGSFSFNCSLDPQHLGGKMAGGNVSESATDNPPKHQYTSLSSLLRSAKASPGSPESAPTQSGQRRGWLNTVQDEGAGTSTSRDRSRSRDAGKEKGKGYRMSIFQMMALTISMGGSQVSPACIPPPDQNTEADGSRSPGRCRSLGIA